MPYQLSGMDYFWMPVNGEAPPAGLPLRMTPAEYARFAGAPVARPPPGQPLTQQQRERIFGRGAAAPETQYQIPGNPGYYPASIPQAEVASYQEIAPFDQISSDPQAVTPDLILLGNLYRYLDTKRDWTLFNRNLAGLRRQDPNYNIHYHEDELLRKAAATADDYRVVEVILENGADPNALDGDALLSAIQRNKPTIFQTLIAFGATVMPQHLTALAASPINRLDLSLIKVFINLFDPAQIRTPNSETRVMFRNLLQQAVAFNNVEVINVLREALQEPASSADNERAFTQAYASNDYGNMLSILNQPNHGSLDLNRFGGLLLELAVRNGAADQIAAIIATGFPVSAFNEAALQLAIKLNQAAVVEALLAQGADKDNAAVKAALARLANPAMTDLVESWTPAECQVCYAECGRDNQSKTCQNNHRLCRTCYNQWRETKQRGDPTRNVHPTRNVPCPSCRANYVLSPHS